MEPKLLLSLAMSLLTSLFSPIHADNGTKQALVVQEPTLTAPRQIHIPKFATNIPNEYYVGISKPCKSISDARNYAIADAVKQILSSINIEYSHEFEYVTSGNVKNINRTVNDKLTRFAKGFLVGVERRIKKSSCSNTTKGYVYFVLVHYPDHLIKEMRRLSKGASVTASIKAIQNNNLIIELTEINGVAVTFNSAMIKVTKVNTYAPFIRYYIWRVSKGSKATYTKAFKPIKVCQSTKNLTLSLNPTEKKAYEVLLGTKVTSEIYLSGVDEVGRAIKANVEF